MIEIAGGILLVVLILAFLRYIIAVIIWIACAALAVGAVGLAAWWLSDLSVEEWIALAAMGTIIVASIYFGRPKRDGVEASS